MGKRIKKAKKAAQPVVKSTVSLLATQINEEFDKTQIMMAKIVEGTIPLTVSLPITQLGLREPFLPSDSEEAFQDSNGNDYGVLKE